MNTSNKGSSPLCFSKLEGLDPKLVTALKVQGLINAFPVQEEVIPTALDGDDLLVEAPTGSGKTLAFGLPIIERIPSAVDVPHAVILVPTRELAVQVCEDLAPLAQAKKIQVVSVFGGAPISKQAQALRQAAIVVATPGRLEDLIRSRKVDLRAVQMLVLDEADRMLDMGFQPQVDAIVAKLPRGKRQTLLFSATLEGRIADAAQSYTVDPKTIVIKSESSSSGTIEHVIWETSAGKKVDALIEALDGPRDLTVVFVRTKRGADNLMTRLRTFGIRATAIHGGMTQRERLREYKRFKDAQCDVLVATDVFARGMDLDKVTLVINYDVPEDADTYRHRTGRTGRAGRSGTAISMMLTGQRKTLRRQLRDAGVALSVFDSPRRTKQTGRRPLPEDQHFVPKVEKARPDKSRSEQSRRRKHPKKHVAKAQDMQRRHTSKARKARKSGAGNGEVVNYNSRKGFGFITSDEGGPDIFFHRDVIMGEMPHNFKRGARVNFVSSKHQRGARATKVQAV